jgi:hypothetical protein
METRDLAQLFVTATARVEFYWNFYTGALLALIGWLVSKNLAVAQELKLLITVGYLAFVLMNVMGLWGAYTFAEALRKDVLMSVNNTPHTVHNTQQVLAKGSLEKQKWRALAIHVVLGAVVLLSVWWAPGDRVERTCLLRCGNPCPWNEGAAAVYSCGSVQNPLTGMGCTGERADCPISGW